MRVRSIAGAVAGTGGRGGTTMVNIGNVIKHGEGLWASRDAMKADLPGIVASQRTAEWHGAMGQANDLAHVGIAPADVLGIQALTGVDNLRTLAPDALRGQLALAREARRTDVAILNVGGDNSHGMTALAEELQMRGANARHLDSKRLRVRDGALQYREGEKGTSWHEVDLPQAMISRGARTQLIQQIEGLGVHVVNPTQLRPITLNKGLQADIFARHGVSHPQTVKHLYSLDDVKVAVAHLPKGPNGEFVVKKVNGFGGQGTWVVRSPEHLEQLAAKHFPPGTDAELLVQQYLELGSADFRFSVVRDVHGAAQVRSVHHRQGLGTDGLANGPEGSRYTRVPLAEADPEAIRMAQKATDALGTETGGRGLDYAGVDVVKASDGKYYVLEINGTAGVSELDVPLARRGTGAVHGEHNLPYVADWLVYGRAT